MSEKKIAGLLIGLFGCGLGAYSAITISNETSNLFSYYNYKPPFCSHEITMMVIAGLSIWLFLIGLGLFTEK